MNGTKSTARKWASLERDVLIRKNISIMLLSETRLMNEESCPPIQGYSYNYSNRKETKNKRPNGGVGILFKSDLEILWIEKSKDWIAQAMMITKQKWVIVSFYIAHGLIRQDKTFFETLSTFIKSKCNDGCYLLLGGDANSHIVELDGRTNPRGKLLEEFAVSHGLNIVNLTNKCSGRYTRGTSAIDFVLTNTSAYEILETMRIDENREVTDISDHNLLTVECSAKIRKSQVKNTIWSTALGKAADETEKILEKVQARNNVSYHFFRNTLIESLNRNKRKIKIPHIPMAHSQTISALESIRKQKNREWRELRRLCLPTDAKEREVRAAQQAVREEVQKELAARDRKIQTEILSAPRNMRHRKFWQYIRREQKNEKRRPEVRDEEGNKIPKYRLENFLTDVAQRKLLGKEATITPENSTKMSQPTGIESTAEDIHRILSQMNANTSTGLDGIPAKILKKLSQIGGEYISKIFNSIFSGEEEIPTEWRDGKVVMIEKPNSKRGNLMTYRPITISTVLYRIFTKILVKNVMNWMENNTILGEMQNGFRSDRRGDDNIFILTSAIELSRSDQTGLICAYLDCTAAYDRVNRQKLWRKLRNINMKESWVEMIQNLYTHNRASMTYNNTKSRWIETNVGLRQGCPLSCVLFMLYISDLDPKLQTQEVGFRVKTAKWTWNMKEKPYFHIPALFFADDIVLMATNYGDMEKLLRITTEFGVENDLEFNPDKSAVVVYSPQNIGVCRELTIQGKILPQTTHYKYLGVVISDAKNYLNKQEECWEKVATTTLHQMHATSLWGFNRFEISKIQWKATAVPKLTYANSVLVMSAGLRLKLEKTQRDAGRWALGIPGAKVSNEFVEGELGWSSFEARDAQSKLRYLERVRSMSQTRWPKTILTMQDLTNKRTKMYQETERLRAKYKCEDISLQYDTSGRPLLNLYNRKIKERILEVQTEVWKQNMIAKSSLELYSKGKTSRGVPSGLYDNRRGSVLLALARADMLPTRTHKMNSGSDKTCPRCGIYEETAKHIIFECNDIYYTEENLLARLGLHTEANTATEVKKAKKVLEDWDKQRSAE